MSLRLSSLRKRQREIRAEVKTHGAATESPASRPLEPELPPARRTLMVRPSVPPVGRGRRTRERLVKGAALLTLGAAGAGIPLLAHQPSNPRPLAVPPPASAEPFPAPSAPPAVVTAPPAPVSAPPPTAPRVPPPLDAAFSGLSQVEKRSAEPFPGIRQLDVTAAGQVLHVVDIDLLRDDYRIRTTQPGERRQTPSSFAQATGALVAINGDWFSYETYGTHGLAMGEGQVWPSAQDLADWLFLACTRDNRCEIDREGRAASIDPAWSSVVGGNGVALVVDGELRQHEDPFYSVDRHPRSAVGLTADGRMLLLAVEGRQSDAQGMSFNEVARLMEELGAVQAMMLDGGGSTSLVVGGQRINQLPDGSGERVVANHLAIIPAGTAPASG